MRFIRALAIITNGRWLPWLVKRLKQKHIEAPAQSAADRALKVRGRVLGAGNGCAVVGAPVGRPAGLAVPHLDVGRAGGGLNLGKGLEEIVEVGVGGVGELLGLPVGEGVGEAGWGMSANLGRTRLFWGRRSHINLTPPWMIGSAVPS